MESGLLMQTVETALRCTLTNFNIEDSNLKLQLELTNEKIRSSVFSDILKRSFPKDTNVRGKILEKSIYKKCEKCVKVVSEKGREICLVIELNDVESKCTECVISDNVQASNRDRPLPEAGSSMSSSGRSTKILVKGSEVCDSQGKEHDSVMKNENSSDNISNETESFEEQVVELDCQLCKESFKTPYLMKKHLKCHGDKPFKCQICSKEFSGQFFYTRHMKSHGHICKICGKIYARPLLLSTHLLTHQDSAKKDFSCDQCGKTFTALSYLRKHMKRNGCSFSKCVKSNISKNAVSSGISPTRRKYKCPVCDENHITQAYLRKHMENHTEKERKACSMVTSRSRQKPIDCVNEESLHEEDSEGAKTVSLKTEQGMSSDPEEGCVSDNGKGTVPNGFVSTGDMEQAQEIISEETRNLLHHHLEVQPDGDILNGGHKKTAIVEENSNTNYKNEHHDTDCSPAYEKDQIQEENAANPGKDTKHLRKKYKCKFCNAIFTKKGSFNKHCQILHSGEAESTFLCYICGKAFSSQGNVDKHVKDNCTFSESEKQRCKVCNKVLSNSVALERHMLHHTANKTHMCELCGKCFLTERSLKAHMDGHIDRRPHKCDICGRRYRNVWHMKVHRKTHTGENLHQCPDCKDWFVNESYLNNQHRNKYCKALQKCSCDVCGRQFSDTKHLHSHMGYHTGERPYMCDKCGKAFAQIPNRDDHYNRHFEQPCFKCPHCHRGFKRQTDLRKHTKRHCSLNDMHLKKYTLPSELKPKDVPQDVIITEQELDQATILLPDESVPEGMQITDEDIQLESTEISTEEMSLIPAALPSLLSSGHVALTLPSSHVTSNGEEITVVLPSELAGCSQNINITESGEILMVAMEPDVVET